MNCIFGADGVYTRFKTFRNKKLDEFELIFFLLNALLFILSWIVFGLGFRMMGGKIGAREVDMLHDSMLVFTCIMTILLVLLSLGGLNVSMDRESHGLKKGCYFILLFFFVGIPLLAEGGAFSAIKNYDIDKIEGTCI